MATNFLTLRSTLTYNRDGTAPVSGSIYTVSADNIPQWSNTLATPNFSSLTGSTISSNTMALASSLTVSSVRAGSIGFSTVIGSTLSANTMALASSLSVSSITAGSMGFSTLIGSSLIAVGNIGIGTNTPPAYRLDLTWQMAMGDRLFGTASNVNNYWIGLRGSGTDGERVAIGMSGDSSGSGAITGITLNTNGSNRMVIGSNGNVGIGTNVPASILDVRTGESADPYKNYIGFHLPTTYSAITQDPIAILRFGWYDDTFNIRAHRGGNTDLTRLSFARGSTENVSLLANGNVGIGITDPGAYKLYVNGNQYVNGQTTQQYSYTSGYSLGTTAGNLSIMETLGTGSSEHYGKLDILGRRSTNGTDWQTTGIRIMRTVDVTNMGWLQFGGIGTGDYGISLGVGSGNTPSLRVDGAGNVGIGSDAPRQSLDVNGSIVTSWGDRLIGTQYNDGSQYFLGMSTNAASRLVSIVARSNDAGGSGGIIFQTGGTTITEKMRITSGGNVGINTDNPSVQLTVYGGPRGFRHTNGTTTLETYIDATYGAWIGSYSNHNLNFYTANSSPHMTIDTAGNVGIGVTAPSYAFQVQHDVSSYGVVQMIRNLNSSGFSAIYWGTDQASVGVIFKNGSARTADGGANTMTIRNDGGDLQLQSQGGLGIRITATNGNVGIGTTIPSQPLTVYAAGSTSYFRSNNSTFTGTYSEWRNYDATGRFIIGCDGNGLAALEAGAGIIGTWTNYGMHFYTNATVRMSINTSGQVGIGTTAPASNGSNLLRLHVHSPASSIWDGWSYFGNQNRGFVCGVYNNVVNCGGHNAALSSWVDITIGSNTYVAGTLSKAAGTFDIPHPLHSTDSRKRLIHSFVEGPRCDLIYRGVAQLQPGVPCVVNLDKDCVHAPECAMETGTFEALCANPQMYLQNMDGFDRVRGIISGAFLTILCENPSSTDRISWMVVAERKDAYIKKWERTNADGFLITEYTSEHDMNPAPLPSSSS